MCRRGVDGDGAGRHVRVPVMWVWNRATDVWPAMAAMCPARGMSRYCCKVLGGCDCGRDDDGFASMEKVLRASWRRPSLLTRDDSGG